MRHLQARLDQVQPELQWLRQQLPAAEHGPHEPAGGAAQQPLQLDRGAVASGRAGQPQRQRQQQGGGHRAGTSYSGPLSAGGGHTSTIQQAQDRPWWQCVAAGVAAVGMTAAFFCLARARLTPPEKQPKEKQPKEKQPKKKQPKKKSNKPVAGPLLFLGG